jgi:signal transduction histidine kinase
MLVLMETCARSEDRGGGRHRPAAITGKVNSAVLKEDPLSDPGDMAALDDERLVRALEDRRAAAAGRLAPGVAHEIANPLSALLGTVELLLEDAAPGSELHRRLLRVQRSGEEIRGTVRALAEFAREPVLDRRRLELSRLCAEAVGLARRGTLAKGVEVVERYPDAPVVVEASPNEVKQIVLALVTSALESGAEGSEVVVEVAVEDRSALVRVLAREAGLGEELLAVVRHLARLQGGEVAIGPEELVLRLPALP